MEPAAMLIRAFKIHNLVAAAIAHALQSGQTRKALRIVEREGVRRA
jgi:hypothetical protein